MADVAARVGMRKASLFYYFESKDDLYGLVLERLLSTVNAAITAAVDGEGTFIERLDELSESVTTAFANQPHAARLLVREAIDWSPATKARLGDSIQTALLTIERFVHQGQAEGHLADVHPKQFTLSLIGLHFLPFAIAEIAKDFTGKAPIDSEFVEARRHAVREHVRGLLRASAC